MMEHNPLNELGAEEFMKELVSYFEPDPVDSAFLGQINKWLTEGKGIVVYQNEDFGSRMLGHRRFFPWGTPDCTFEGEPPQRLPDFPQEINFRYQRLHTYLGPTLGQEGADA